MFSVSQLLSDGKSVVALDIALNRVQDIAESMTMNDKGYGFIMDSTGLIIAHLDKSQKGKVYPENEEQKKMLHQIFDNKKDNFEMSIGGEKCTIFSNQVLNDWHVVMVVSDIKLFHDLRKQMMIGIMITVTVFLIVVVFCSISVRRINKYQQKENESKASTYYHFLNLRYSTH